MGELGIERYNGELVIIQYVLLLLSVVIRNELRCGGFLNRINLSVLAFGLE